MLYKIANWHSILMVSIVGFLHTFMAPPIKSLVGFLHTFMAPFIKSVVGFLQAFF